MQMLDLAAEQPTFIHAGIRVADGGLLAASSQIPSGELLLAVQGTTSSMLPAALGSQELTVGYDFAALLCAVSNRFEQALDQGGQLSRGAVVLAIRYMHDSSKGKLDTETVEKSALCWPDESPVLEFLAGTTCGDAVGSLRDEAALVFEVVITPLLGEPLLAPHFTARGKTLEQTFTQALALVMSRATPALPSEPLDAGAACVAPLLDRVGFLPEGHPDVNIVLTAAAETAEGRAVQLTTCRALEPDEPLLLAAGRVASSRILAARATVPSAISSWPSMHETVSLCLEPGLFPDPPGSTNAALRWRVLSTAGCSESKLYDDMTFELSASDLDAFRESGQTPQALKQLRSVLVLLCVASPKQLADFEGGGELGAIAPTALGRAFVAVFEQNIERVVSCVARLQAFGEGACQRIAGAAPAKAASSEIRLSTRSMCNSCSRACSAERGLLLRWRDAVCRAFSLPIPAANGPPPSVPSVSAKLSVAPSVSPVDMQCSASDGSSRAVDDKGLRAPVSIGSHDAPSDPLAAAALTELLALGLAGMSGAKVVHFSGDAHETVDAALRAVPKVASVLHASEAAEARNWGRSLGWANGCASAVLLWQQLSSGDVTEQRRIIAEAARLVAPGGRLLVGEADFASWSCALTDGDALNAALLAAVHTAVRDPFAARRASGELHSAGLAVASHAYSGYGSGQDTAGWELMKDAVASVGAQAEALEAERQRRITTGQCALMRTYLCAVGTRPAAAISVDLSHHRLATVGTQPRSPAGAAIHGGSDESREARGEELLAAPKRTATLLAAAQASRGPFGCWAGLKSLATAAAASPLAAHLPPLGAADTSAVLDRGDVFVQPCLLWGADLERLRDAARRFAYSRVAADVVRRYASDGVTTTSVDLLARAVWPELPAPLLEAVASFDALRATLAAQSGRTFLDIIELQLLKYDAGGEYARHLDAGGGSDRASPVKRSVSFLWYLTPDGWSGASGGHLRVWEGVSGSHRDILPAAGTFVAFDSASVPHAVLRTSRERLVLVGWFLEKRTT